MRVAAMLVVLGVGSAAAADFAMPGGPEPRHLDETFAQLRRDPYDIELLLSYGTSKGGSAGHVALAVRGELPGDDLVYSANFYADRDDEHAKSRYVDDLIVRVPKKEYLYGTRSTLGARAAFGLDYGEVYKRTVVGVRVAGIPERDRKQVVAYLESMNADFHARARDTEYEAGEVKYGYTGLNCAKTIGSAFHYGAGYRDVSIRTAPRLGVRVVARALNANTPSEMAEQLLRAFKSRGYTMDAVVYLKYPDSRYVDPLEDEPIAFANLPNRFPSVISLDFVNDDAAYEDPDNVRAMALLRSLVRYRVVVDETHALAIERKDPQRRSP